MSMTTPVPDVHDQRPQGERRPPSLGARLWFVWMVLMWVVFFALLSAGRLDSVREAVSDLNVVVQVVLWIVFLPWLLGTYVWTSSLAEWLRVSLVVVFAVGWTVASWPRRRRPKAKPRRQISS